MNGKNDRFLICFYFFKGPKKGVFVKNQTSDSQKTAVEILAPSLTLSIEKFIQYRPPAKGKTFVFRIFLFIYCVYFRM